MTEQQILLTFFIVNWLLVIVDASLGYFILPRLIPRNPADALSDAADGYGSAVGGMRRLLAIMVLLYMLANCYAFYQRYANLLYLVTFILLLDIFAQLFLRWIRLRRR